MRFALALTLAVSVSAATLEGIQIHSTTTGSGPKTVILVHGWTCDETSWAAQVPALSKEYRVVTLDLPGHGKRSLPRDGKFSMDLFARAIEAVRAEARADRVVLAGHSMGVPVIRHYARMYPQHAVALVFVDGPVNRPGNLPANFGQQMGGPDGLKARETMIRGMFSTATTPEMQKHILDMMLAAPEATAVGAINATFDPAVWKDEMFAGPVLGIYTEAAGATNRDGLKRFPKSEYHAIPGAGHFLMVEKPVEFNRLVLEFLSKQRF